MIVTYPYINLLVDSVNQITKTENVTHPTYPISAKTPKTLGDRAYNLVQFLELPQG